MVFNGDQAKEIDENTREDMTEDTEASHSDKESLCSNMSESNVIIQRRLTEKRKDYVVNISKSFKNPKISNYEELLMKYDRSGEKPEPVANKIKLFSQIIEQNKKREESLKVTRRPVCTEKLFECCYLIGYNNLLKKPYVKTVYPANSKTIPYIEEFVYPYSENMPVMRKEEQNFCLILTDENGRHVYGYCRQILPESTEICLPLTYCIVSSVRSTGFYYSVLREIESRHGQTEQQMSQLLKCIQENPVPKSGAHLSVKLAVKAVSVYIKDDVNSFPRPTGRLSVDSQPTWMARNQNYQTFGSRSPNAMENQRFDEIFIKRPLDLRLESSELSDIYENSTISLLTSMFGTLLIERKVILLSKSVAKLSSCIFALETILYPFKWQHTIITIVPDHLLELAEAPFPILVGILNTGDNFDCTNVSNGIVVDLDKKVLLKQCGDEKTLLPRVLKKPLVFSLELVDVMDQEKILSNVLIAEAFVKFFVELFCDLDANTYEVSFLTEKF